MKYNKLTPEEKYIIEDKGTELPFSGDYDKFFEVGIYICKRCNSPLYESNNKFNSNCGWPSFDDELPNAVKRIPDADGKRTEILCNNCDAHLGHVFTGENFTKKNTRHCVNSLSIKFISKNYKKGEIQKAVFGGGCFWCIEAVYNKLKGVESAISGYAGGRKNNPTYEDICKGNTGHAEVVEITFNPDIISFNDLLSVFFVVHDPTTINRQGHDIGEQYRSIILYKIWQQKEQAEKFISTLEKEKIYNNPIVTQIDPLLKFYKAEEYHQNYFDKNPQQAFCQVNITPKLSKLKEKFSHLL